MIIFQNPGAIDRRSFFIHGLNAKQSTSAIGTYGTGLKYALAIAARRGWRVIVQPGDGTQAEMEISPTDFRGKDFTIPRLFDRDLPFTTELGKNWEPWQAYRELICNAWDEGGDAEAALITPKPEHNITRIILISDEIEAIHSAKDNYFWNGEKAFTIDDEVECRPGSGRLFFRGILIGHTPKECHFDYNTTEEIYISEDRTITQSGVVSYINYIRAALMYCTNEDLIEQHITAPAEHWLSEFNLYIHDCDYPSMITYNKVANELFDAGSVRLNRHLAECIRKIRREKQSFPSIPLSPPEQVWRDRVVKLMQERGWNILAHDVVWKAKLDRNDLFGCVRQDKIVISERAWEYGFETVLATAIEEFIHIAYNYTDHSRSMQDWLVRNLAKAIAE